jgi:hypothetical protein
VTGKPLTLLYRALAALQLIYSHSSRSYHELALPYAQVLLAHHQLLPLLYSRIPNDYMCTPKPYTYTTFENWEQSQSVGPSGLVNYMLSTMGVTRAGALTRTPGTRTNPHNVNHHL